MLRRASLALLLLSAAGVAHASDKPVYQEPADWVKPAPTPNTKALTDDAPVFLVADSQSRVADGTVYSYRESAIRAVSAQALAQIGTVKLNWHPDHGDLIVHRVDILRDGQRVDLLKAGARFTVLRREQELEQLQLDGMLTAILPVEGLRVGDVLDVSYTVTSKDPALKGNVGTIAPIITEPAKLGFARTRLLWADGSGVKWKAYPIGATPQASDAGGWHELVFPLPAPKQPDLPPAAPARFHRLPAVELSSFPDWASVSATMAPLYATDGLIKPGTPLADEVAKIARATPDPLKRTALALALVQDKIRYLAQGMENGNLVPQAPEKSWAVRYGDCKAKTLLLLSMLHALGVEAQPILANLGAGDLVADRLPGVGAFNHILVLATVNGQKLWLDGTALGARPEDITDVPPLKWVLPVQAQGAALLQVPARAPSRPMLVSMLDVDSSAGIDLPAPFVVTLTLRGPMVGLFKAAIARASGEERDKLLDGFGSGLQGNGAIGTRSVSFDDANGTATVKLTGVTTPTWLHEDERYRFATGRGGLPSLPDRSRAAWKDIPIATGSPERTATTFRMRLPDGGRGFTLEGDQALDVTLAGGRAITRKASLSDGVLTVEENLASSGGEILPAEIAPTRARIAQLQSHVLRVSSAPGYPAPWAAVAAAKRAHRFDTAEAAYTASIANKPDEASRYVARAVFYETIFERQKALADIGKAIAIEASAENYLRRAALYEQLGQTDQAIADAKAAHELEPGQRGVIARLALLQADKGAKTDALALVQERIDEAGEDKPEYLGTKAEVLARVGDRDGAIATVDEALQAKPTNAALLNERCWLKGTLNVALDTAMKDCTRSIELSDSEAPAALDSRAMVHFRMGQMAEALVDLNAALDLRPAAATSIYLRAVVERRLGNAKAAEADLAAARLLYPNVAEEYARYGIKP